MREVSFGNFTLGFDPAQTYLILPSPASKPGILLSLHDTWSYGDLLIGLA